MELHGCLSPERSRMYHTHARTHRLAATAGLRGRQPTRQQQNRVSGKILESAGRHRYVSKFRAYHGTNKWNTFLVEDGRDSCLQHILRVNTMSHRKQ